MSKVNDLVHVFAERLLLSYPGTPERNELSCFLELKAWQLLKAEKSLEILDQGMGVNLVLREVCDDVIASANCYISWVDQKMLTPRALALARSVNATLREHCSRSETAFILWDPTVYTITAFVLHHIALTIRKMRRN